MRAWFALALLLAMIGWHVTQRVGSVTAETSFLVRPNCDQASFSMGGDAACSIEITNATPETLTDVSVKASLRLGCPPAPLGSACEPDTAIVFLSAQPSPTSPAVVDGATELEWHPLGSGMLASGEAVAVDVSFRALSRLAHGQGVVFCATASEWPPVGEPDPATRGGFCLVLTQAQEVLGFTPLPLATAMSPAALPETGDPSREGDEPTGIVASVAALLAAVLGGSVLAVRFRRQRP